ncbi:melanoma antigen recognized by T-cells 1 [Bombina bombina]|uniref:melanoma antigen recognized by T-cells 1 n=1 Tax=Bombina bombina TaxID=8345 RepID=UPI00235B27A2|nr:melanoma antigen recognized by T-cells 1 [Bombina bombina]XP_053558536.1 melanoma antigen recognized by T-cells 1 [Bombina bombina]
MPRPDSLSTLGEYSSSGRGRGHIRLSAEQTAGIAILAIVIALLFIFGCWYYKRRSGYKILGSHQFSPAAIRNFIGGSSNDNESKMPLQDYSTMNSVVPGAPPAYEKISTDFQPPPYTP